MASTASQISFPLPAMFCRDNLEVLRGLNSASVDLIYLDPPFNKGKEFHAPVGSKASGASFSDIWSEDMVKEDQFLELADTHPALFRYIDGVEGVASRSAKWYLIFMAVRLVEMHRVLKDAGSIYLHCDPTASHYLKPLMDGIWGHANFRNEIVWAYRTGGVSKKYWPRKHDVLLFYSKTAKYGEQHKPIQERVYYETGFFGTSTDEEGRQYTDVYVRDVWEGLSYEIDNGGIRQVNIKPLINTSRERVDYPTQKPLALLERIVRASSEPGDLVLDPFCGCATTCVAAHLHDRHWIGVDVSPRAYELVQERLNQETSQGRLEQGKVPEIYYSEDIPLRSDIDTLKPLTGKHKTAEVSRLYGEQGGHCNGCGTHFEKQHLTIDHKIPKSAGGTDHPDNIQLLCHHCNSIKGNRPMEYLQTRIRLRESSR